MPHSKFKILIIFGIMFHVSCFMFHFVPVARADTDVNQQILDLRRKVEELTKLAAQYRGNVIQKQKEADTLKRQIDIMNNQILRLQTEIQISNEKINATRMQITDLQGRIFDTQQSIAREQGAVGEIMRYLNQRDGTTMIATLIGVDRLSDFADQTEQANDLTKRLSSFLKDLREKKIILEKSVASLNEQKVTLESLNKQQIGQKQSLDINKSSKNKLLINTKGLEAQYQKMLSDTEQQEAAVFAEMQKLEQDAIHNGTVITHVTATAVPPRGTKIFVSPYHDQDYQSQGYGMTPYARRGAYGRQIHNGIDLVSGYGSPIYPIGSGVVLASGLNDGFGNWVAIKHDAGGGMVSIYGHMNQSTVVGIGRTVTTDTILGYEGTTGHVTGSHLHLSIYKDFFTYINPKNGQLYFNYADGSVNPLDYIQ